MMVVLLPIILTFVIRELAVFAFEEEVPQPLVGHREGRIAGFSRHLDSMIQVMSVKCTGEKQLAKDGLDIFLRVPWSHDLGLC